MNLDGGEREREKPLLSAAIQWVTDLFKFMEKAPPCSTTILCKDSSVCDEGTLAKSGVVKDTSYTQLSDKYFVKEFTY